MDAADVADVEKQAVDVVAEEVEDLLGLLHDVVEVGRGEVHLPPAGGQRPGAAAVALLIDLDPFGVLGRHVLVQSDGDVDRRLDVSLVAGFELLGEQIAGQVRVPGREPRIMVDQAVVAAREERHRIDVRPLEGIDEFVGPELAAIPGLLRGMEVEVDLAETKRAHRRTLPAGPAPGGDQSRMIGHGGQ